MKKKKKELKELSEQEISLLRGETPAKAWGAASARLSLQKRGLLDADGQPTERGRHYLARYEAGALDKSEDTQWRALRDVITLGGFARELAGDDDAAYERWRGTLKKACQRAVARGEFWCRRDGDTWLLHAPYARKRWRRAEGEEK